jgi:mRNA interferase MazF
MQNNSKTGEIGMNVIERKEKLLEIINSCKGWNSLSNYLGLCSINFNTFKKNLNLKDSTFTLTHLDIQKIIANADSNLSNDEINHIENELLSLIDYKDNELNIYRGQFYWVNFGNDVIGSEQGGIRPAYVIQNNAGNKYSSTIIVLAITSQLTKKELPTHTLLSELESSICGLEKQSLLLAEQIRTVAKQRVVSYIGEAPMQLKLKIDETIKKSVGVYNPLDIADFTKGYVEEYKFSNKYAQSYALAKYTKDYFEKHNYDLLDNNEITIAILRDLFIQEKQEKMQKSNNTRLSNKTVQYA